MKEVRIFPVGKNEAIRYACGFLEEEGLCVCEEAGQDVTHLLLPVPSFDKNGQIRGGGELEALLPLLPTGTKIIGGNLGHPELAGYRRVDLLRDEGYTAQNSAITADCAIRVAGTHLKQVFSECPVLIIGWGRIGKFLAKQLRSMGARVTVAARKERDRALLRELGVQALDTASFGNELGDFRLIFNTVPAMVLPKEQMDLCHPQCVKIELASSPGMEGTDVISALGLPGKMTPESSGKLIAQTIIRKIREEEGI